MSVFRRLLIVAACALALAASGCVEITNPQFDARYRSTVRPMEKLPYAVFAVYHEPSGKTPRASSATIVVIDTADGSVVTTIGIDDVVRISDVGGPNPSVLAVLDHGFAQVNLRTSETTRLATAKLFDARATSAAFDDKGIRVFLQRSGLSMLVTRRVGANEQTAGVPLRQILNRYRTVTDLLLMTANEREAYYLARYEQHTPMMVPGRENRSPYLGELVLEADFTTHSVALTGTPTAWPAGFSLAEGVHAERAVRRWGLPVEAPDGDLAFVSLDGVQRAIPATSTVGPFGPQIVFQPDGTYLQVRRQAVPFGAGSVSWAVAQGSVGTTVTHVVYQQELPTPGRIPIDPLGVIGDNFAFGIIRPAGLGTGEASSAAGTLRATYDLHLHAIETGRDVVVASIPSPSEEPRADFLGTFAPAAK